MPQDVDLPGMQTKILDWLQTKMPQASNFTISDLQKPGMGFSSETYLLDINWEEAGEAKSMETVLRAAPRERGVFPEYDLGLQFRIMQILGGTKVPVARMLWLEEDPSVIGVQFFLMEKLDGDVPQDYPSYHGSGMYFEATPELRAKIWWGSLKAMAEIHKLDWKKMGFTFLPEPKSAIDAVDRQLTYWDSYLNNWIKDDPQESHPIIESALEWLKENRYEPERLTLCWGDARIGNTLYSRPNRDVLAIMDWEMAFIGDPEADLAWFITVDKEWTEGFGLSKLEGTPEDEEIIQHYETLTGWKVKNYFYNEVMATFRHGLTMIAVLKRFQEQGIPIEEDMILNNFPTRHLADLIGLPPPGEKKQVIADINEVTVSVQFHLTGPGGSDWYLVCDKGKGARYDGITYRPDCTIKVSAEDWRAIQAGELNQLEAWSTGRLVTEGDLALLSLLQDMMAEFTEA
jgi:aminoglycoside phosphotransferase (APT) family kinase protein/putative sterol carrier protein